jgi:hypothetical protein
MLWLLSEIILREQSKGKDLTEYLEAINRENYNYVMFMPHWVQIAQWTI